MKRLTERLENGVINVKYASQHETAIHRLVTIEDILGDEYDLDRLRELAQADREGRCVVLPVKIGDSIYFTFLGKIIKKQVFSVVTFCNYQKIYCNGTSLYFGLDDIGETVFITREAAEEAMKERENENGTKI